ncbi:mechanosensitive ion channel protein 6-like [Panicum miliaceum]|uniref:Mechanosensitive ion channel protein n=1 Tax=Panicum miliaceum TaxID=4540 RepID=A0A3L6QIJ3_PANMI|nr:mechanosensitive ion channel protein 6-like [Panicum miliaceum]
MDQARRKSSLRTQGSGKSSSRPGSGALDPRPAEDVVVRVDGNGNGHAPFSFHGADGGGVGGRVGNATPSTNSTATTPRTASGPRSSETSSPRSPAKVWREGSYEFWNSDGGGGNGADGRPAATEAFSFKNRQPQSPSQVPSPSLSPQQQPAPASAAPEGGAVDPPTRLIENFLRKQAASGGEVALDLDLEMEELGRAAQLREQPSFSSSLERDARVSFREPQKRRSTSSCSSGSDTDDGPKRGGGDDGEVVRCTSSSTAAGAGPLLRAKTRSRLMDPPPQSQPAPAPATAAAPVIDEERKSSIPRTPTKSGQLFSGLMSGKKSGPMGKSGPMDEEEDDPFADEDIPDDFKRGKLDFLTVLQWLGLFLVIAALVCSVTIRILSEKKVLGLHLWKWELLVFVLICGRLVSGWVIRIAVFGVERNFLLRKRVLYFVYGVRSAVQNALWLGLVLASWHFMFDKNVQQETNSTVLPYVTKILFCFLVATLIRLVKTLLLKVLASSFHVSTYFDRIQEALFNQNIQLSGVMPKGEGSKQLSKEKGEGISIDMLHKLNQKNVSAWNMKRLMRIVRFGTLTTMDEQIQQATGEGDESATQIRSEYEAKIAAKRIFNNVATPGSKYIYLSDLMRFMRREEAIKAMDLFEGAQEHNRVSKRSLKNWVVNAFRERKALALTLNDTKTAVNKLNQMANVVVGIIVFALGLLILGIATTHFFVFLSSQLLLAVFVFGNTLKTVFEAIVFLFVMHPFDVGDRCEVEGVQMVVEEMNIMTTVFLRYDNLKIYYPNSVLATKPIMNFYRSPDMGDAVDFSIHVATPVEKLALMKERILRYIDNKKEHWYPGAMVVLRDVDDTNKLKVSIWLRHTLNFQDMGMRFVRRELVLQEMIRVLKDLEIEYRMLPLDVNVRNAPPIQSTRMPTTWSYS